MYRSESSSPSRVTLALGLPSDRHRLLGGTVACVLFGEVVHQVGTSGLAQSLVPHPGPGPQRLSASPAHPGPGSHLDMGSVSLLTITQGCSSIPSIQLELSSPAHSGMQLDPIKPAKPVSAGSAGVRRSGIRGSIGSSGPAPAGPTQRAGSM